MADFIDYLEFAFDGETTLSMCVRGNDEDKKIVAHFFDLMEKNLDSFIAE